MGWAPVRRGFAVKAAMMVAWAVSRLGACTFLKEQTVSGDIACPGGGGGDSLRPYSQQRPMRPNLSCCLGLIANGQHKNPNRFLVLVPHERSHGIMRILKNICMLLLKPLKTRAIKDTMGSSPIALAAQNVHLGYSPAQWAMSIAHLVSHQSQP